MTWITGFAVAMSRTIGVKTIVIRMKKMNAANMTRRTWATTCSSKIEHRRSMMISRGIGHTMRDGTQVQVVAIGTLTMKSYLIWIRTRCSTSLIDSTMMARVRT